MKQLFIIGFILMTINLSAQYSTLHLDIGTYWKVDAYNSVGSGFGNLEIKSESIKDTIISGMKYYVIRTITKHTGFNIVHYSVSNYTYIRNDTLNQRVYAYINGSDSLIYNFDLTIGDTLFSTVPNNPADLTIDSIYTENYYGVNRKVFATKDTFGNIQRKLIEGLGSEFGFIAYSYDPGFENGAFTKCIKFNGATFYGDSSITCDLPLGIEDIQNALNISLYPNPANDKIMIELDKSILGAYTLELKTVYGNTLFRKESKLANESIDISNLTSGIYLLTISNSDRIYTQKIIKE